MADHRQHEPIAGAVLAWYERNRRDLPWRARPGEMPDPYRVWLSEVMLQQTTVAVAGRYFAAFLARWPALENLAEASLDEVLAAWAGLGYYARARNLHACARMVVAEHGGRIPQSIAELGELPGIGRYTAAAIAAQVDDADVVGIEVNIRRVCERFAGRRLSGRAAQAVAVDIAEPLRGRDRLLALMDLGATVCTARVPDCAACPIASRCATRGALAGETKHRQARYEGSFRQRRGGVMAQLRAHDAVAVATLDPEALQSLVRDGLAEVTGTQAHLPAVSRV